MMDQDADREPQVEETGDARDIALMGRVQQGDMEAFRELVESHQGRIVGTVAKMLGDESEAEDVSQQVFVRIWKSAGRYQATAKFTTWLFKITRNLVFNELRRRKRHPNFSLDAESESGEGAREMVDATARTPSGLMQEEELQEAIRKAIDGLPETQRMAVVLRRYEDLSYQEIADVLGLTVPAIKSLLFRARTELKEALKGYL